MLIAAAALCLILAALTWVSVMMAPGPAYWRLLLVGWGALGIFYSMSVTPSGRLLKRSANAEDRPALFAAQFALSHVAWLLCYPLAGQLGANVSMTAAFIGMAAIAGLGMLCGLLLWPAGDPEILPHVHEDISEDHEHVRQFHGGDSSAHAYVIDDLHPYWVKRA